MGGKGIASPDPECFRDGLAMIDEGILNKGRKAPVLVSPLRRLSLKSIFRHCEHLKGAWQSQREKRDCFGIASLAMTAKVLLKMKSNAKCFYPASSIEDREPIFKGRWLSWHKKN
jgi:hypothetical protein